MMAAAMMHPAAAAAAAAAAAHHHHLASVGPANHHSWFSGVNGPISSMATMTGKSSPSSLTKNFKKKIVTVCPNNSGEFTLVFISLGGGDEGVHIIYKNRGGWQKNGNLKSIYKYSFLLCSITAYISYYVQHI